MRMVEVVDAGELSDLRIMAQALQAKYRGELGSLPGVSRATKQQDDTASSEVASE